MSKRRIQTGSQRPGEGSGVSSTEVKSKMGSGFIRPAKNHVGDGVARRTEWAALSSIEREEPAAIDSEVENAADFAARWGITTDRVPDNSRGRRH